MRYILVVLLLSTVFVICKTEEKVVYDVQTATITNLITATTTQDYLTGAWYGDFPVKIEKNNVVADTGTIEFTDEMTFRLTKMRYNNFYVTGTYNYQDYALSLYPVNVISFDDSITLTHPSEVWSWTKIAEDDSSVTFQDDDLDKLIHLDAKAEFPQSYPLIEQGAIKVTAMCDTTDRQEVTGSNIMVEIEILDIHSLSPRPRSVYAIGQDNGPGYISVNMYIPYDYYWVFESAYLKAYYYFLPDDMFVRFNKFPAETIFSYPHHSDYSSVHINSSPTLLSSLEPIIEQLSLTDWSWDSKVSWADYTASTSLTHYYVHMFGYGFNGCQELIEKSSYTGDYTCSYMKELDKLNPGDSVILEVVGLSESLNVNDPDDLVAKLDSSVVAYGKRVFVKE